MKITDIELIRRIANNCRKATFLIEKRENESLMDQEEQELAIHLSGCSICREYQRQSALITQLVTHTSQRASNILKLDNGFKARLQQQIDDLLLS